MISSTTASAMLETAKKICQAPMQHPIVVTLQQQRPYNKSNNNDDKNIVQFCPHRFG